MTVGGVSDDRQIGAVLRPARISRVNRQAQLLLIKVFCTMKLKMKGSLTVLALISAIATACSSGTTQSSTTPTATPQIQPPIVNPKPSGEVAPTTAPISDSPGQTTQPPTVSNPKPTPITDAKTAEVLVNDLNVRSAPNTTSKVEGTLPKGTQAKIIQRQGDWYYIVMGRVEGWVSGSYIKVLDGNPGSVR